MGLIYAEIELVNSTDLALAKRGVIEASEVKRQKVRALVDSAAAMLVIPEHLQLQLDIPEIERREAVTADGKVHIVPVVGPVNVHFKNRLATCNAMVIGNDEVLLGAIPLEELDVVMDPRSRTLDVNPESPTMPKMLVKRHGE